MVYSGRSISLKVLAALVGFGALTAQGMPLQAETIPTSTAIPVIFTRTLVAGKVKIGDTVTAKTTQVVFLPGGQALPDGTILIGHVIESTPFVPNPVPYAIVKPSALSVRFDEIAENASTIPVSLTARAIAGPVVAHEASILHYRDETDTTGTRILVGGESFSPIEREVVSPSGDVVGYNRRQGVFARLIARDDANGESTVYCEATNSEQSLGIFSANACGVYGLDSIVMSDNGSNGKGTFTLESRRETVTLYANSVALLQVVESGQ